MKQGSIFERVFTRVEQLMPAEMGGEMRENIKTGLQSVLAEMDVVTREEFDIQRKMLDKALARVAELEKKCTPVQNKKDGPQKGSNNDKDT